MPYIGNTIRAADDYRLIDDISSSFNGSTTSFALQVAGSAPVPFPKSPQQVLISVNGVIQEPDPSGSSGFNLVGTNIVFSSAPTNGHAFFGIIYATADYLNAGGNFPAGSLGAPSITFIGDENTGLYRKGGGSIGFVADATEIANTDSNGLTISSGNLIIPDSIIHGGDTNTKIRFPSTDTFTVEVGGTERLRVASTGNLVIPNDNDYLQIGEGQDLALVHNGAASFITNNTGFLELQSDGITFEAANGTERVRIDTSGRLRIASTVEAADGAFDDLIIGNHSGNRGISILSGATSQGAVGFGKSGTTADGYLAYMHNGTATSSAMTLKSQGHIKFNAGSSTKFYIEHDGKVGIGTTSPGRQLSLVNSSGAIAEITTNTNGNTSALYLHEGAVGSTTNGGAILYDGANNRLAICCGTTLTTERVTINRDNGNVGIGTTSPAFKLDVVDGTGRFLGTQNDGSKTCLILDNNGTGTTDAAIGFASGGSSQKASIRAQVLGNGAMMFHTNNDTEKMRISAGGNVGIGTTSPAALLDVVNTGGAAEIICSSSTQPRLMLKTSGTTAECRVDFGDSGDSSRGAIGYNHSDDALKFYTTGVANERMRIDSSGNVGIGSSPLSRFSIVQSVSSGSMMTIRNTQSRADGVRYGIEFRDSSNEANGTISIEQTGSNNQAEMRFNINNGTGGNGITNGTNAVTFLPGSQFFNCTSSPTSGTSGQRFESGGTAVIGVSTTGGKNCMEFNNPNGNVGRITSSGSNVTFHTSSDYRLKENETTISDGITRLKTLIPRRFNWKVDETNTKQDGFFAHEVSSVVPEAIDGVKDGVYAEDDLDRGITKGDPLYQMIDHSKLIPLLTAALQEEVSKREALETRIAALEAA